MYRINSGFRIKSGAFVTATIVSLILSSCIDDPPTHPEVNDYQSYITLVWELFDQKYVAFDVKNVDWDAVHEEYSQMAAGIGSFAELQDVIIQMIGTLEDKNAFLRIWDPSLGYVIHPTCSPENEINYVDSVLMAYLDPWMFTWDGSETWGYCIIDTIPYFAIKGFDYFFTFQTFKDVILDNIDAPGIIIDIRMSDGESLVPAIQIPGIFTDQTVTAFFTQYRTGPQHDDLSPLAVHNVFSGSLDYMKPVALLTGEQNFGASEAFVSVMAQFPQVTIIGDTTGGGGNIPGYFDQMYWPLWEMDNITCPFARVLTADTVSIEGNGILPDIYVQTTPADFLAGHDPVLEYAIEWIAAQTAR